MARAKLATDRLLECVCVFMCVYVCVFMYVFVCMFFFWRRAIVTWVRLTAFGTTRDAIMRATTTVMVQANGEPSCSSGYANLHT